LWWRGRAGGIHVDVFLISHLFFLPSFLFVVIAVSPTAAAAAAASSSSTSKDTTRHDIIAVIGFWLDRFRFVLISLHCNSVMVTRCRRELSAA
jgi:predicted acyltransferase